MLMLSRTDSKLKASATSTSPILDRLLPLKLHDAACHTFKPHQCSSKAHLPVVGMSRIRLKLASHNFRLTHMYSLDSFTGNAHVEEPSQHHDDSPWLKVCTPSPDH